MDKQSVIARLKSLQLTYRPNPDVLSQLSHINMLAVVGPSGAGKSTITKKSGLPFVVGDTTRAPREGEIHGRDYNFRNDPLAVLEEVERGEFVQYVIQRDTEMYGTKSSSYPSSGVCVMSVLSSTLPRFRQLGFGSVTPVFIVPPNNSEWMRRIAAHRDRDLDARLQEAKESLVAALSDSQYLFILNDNLDSAVAALRDAATGNIDHSASSRARASATTLFETLQKAIR